MKRRKSGLIAIILIFIFLLSMPFISASPLCTGFGSISHTPKTVTIEPGSSNVISLSLFNCKDKDLYVDITVDNLPLGWWTQLNSKGMQRIERILLESKEPTQRPTAGKTWFILEDGKSYIETTPVELRIGTPENLWGGLYELKVSVIATSASAENSEGVSIVPKFGRELSYDIQVPAPYKPQEITREDNTPSDNKNEKTENPVDAVTSEDDKGNDDFFASPNDPGNEASLIEGSETKDVVEAAAGDGFTGFSVGGVSSSSIIIVILIILVIAALLFYLRQ